MHKIVYYENVLEFKKNTQAKLKRSDVNYWMLCRTCLCDVDSDCPDLLKVCIMGTDGGLLNVKQMLAVATGLQIHVEDKLPLKICKDCLNKLSTFYFFKLQTERSENVLNRLWAQLFEAEAGLMPSESIVLKSETNISEKTRSPIEIDQESIHTVGQVREEDDASVTFVDAKEILVLKQDEQTEQEQDQESEHEQQSEQEPESEHEQEAKQDPEQEQEQLEEHVLEEIITSDDHELMDVESIGYFVRKVNDEVQVELQFAEDADEKQNENIVKTEEVTESMEEEYYLDNEDETSNSNNTDDGEVLLLNLEDVVNVEVLDENENGSEDTNVMHKVDSTTKEIEDEEEEEGESEDEEYASNEPKKKKTKVVIPLLENLNCNLCGSAFVKQCFLVAHVQDKHPNTKAFKCRVCGKMFTHLQSLSRHMVTHKTVQYRNVCDLCGKAFLRTDDWKRHTRVHTGERPYICTTCGKAFKQTNELKEHQLTHIKGKLFVCNICGHRMSSRNGLYIHRRAHAGIKNFICNQCDKRFLTNGELKSHMNVHFKRAQLEEE